MIDESRGDFKGTSRVRYLINNLDSKKVSQACANCLLVSELSSQESHNLTDFRKLYKKCYLRYFCRYVSLFYKICKAKFYF